MKAKTILFMVSVLFIMAGCAKDNNNSPSTGGTLKIDNSNNNNNNNNNSTGEICFWSDATMANGGGVNVYVDGSFAGSYNNYFTSGTPDCGQSGTLTVTLSPGTHYFTANSGSGDSWAQTSFVTVGGQCLKMDLYK